MHIPCSEWQLLHRSSASGPRIALDWGSHSCQLSCLQWFVYVFAGAFHLSVEIITTIIFAHINLCT